MDIKKLYEIYRNNGFKVTTDSRQVSTGAVFFALRGEKFDGNTFAQSAIDKGAAIAVIDNPDYQIPGKTFLVNDALKTLQELAHYHRRQLDIPVIGITGTAGKTTTKELIKAVLQQKYKTFATEGNLNNHIGVPLSLLKIKPGTEIAVIEMGASYPGDIKLLCDIARPDHGLITNIGTAHIQGFGSRENLIKTKTELYRHLEQNNGTIFINIDDKLLTSLTAHDKLYTYGTADQAQVRGISLGINPFLTFKFFDREKTYTVNTKLFGEYNFYNALAAVAAGKYFDVPPEKIKTAIEAYQPQNQRSQIIKTDKNTLIADLYNANPTSMSQALKSFAKINANNKILIIGDMLELGGIEEQEHAKILQLAKELGLENIYLVGKIFGKVNNKYPHFETSDELREFLQKNPVSNATILLKASRGIHLEKLLDVL